MSEKHASGTDRPTSSEKAKRQRRRVASSSSQSATPTTPMPSSSAAAATAAPAAEEDDVELISSVSQLAGAASSAPSAAVAVPVPQNGSRIQQSSSSLRSIPKGARGLLRMAEFSASATEAIAKFIVAGNKKSWTQDELSVASTELSALLAEVRFRKEYYAYQRDLLDEYQRSRGIAPQAVEAAPREDATHAAIAAAAAAATATSQRRKRKLDASMPGQITDADFSDSASVSDAESLGGTTSSASLLPPAKRLRFGATQDEVSSDMISPRSVDNMSDEEAAPEASERAAAAAAQASTVLPGASYANKSSSGKKAGAASRKTQKRQSKRRQIVDEDEEDGSGEAAAAAAAVPSIAASSVFEIPDDAVASAQRAEESGGSDTESVAASVSGGTTPRRISKLRKTKDAAAAAASLTAGEGTSAQVPAAASAAPSSSVAEEEVDEDEDMEEEEVSVAGAPSSSASKSGKRSKKSKMTKRKSARSGKGTTKGAGAKAGKTISGAGEPSAAAAESMLFFADKDEPADFGFDNYLKSMQIIEKSFSKNSEFWSYVDTYFVPISTARLKLLDPASLATESPIPPLGKHYTERWAEEDAQLLGTAPPQMPDALNGGSGMQSSQSMSAQMQNMQAEAVAEGFGFRRLRTSGLAPDAASAATDSMGGSSSAGIDNLGGPNDALSRALLDIDIAAEAFGSSSSIAQRLLSSMIEERDLPLPFVNGTLSLGSYQAMGAFDDANKNKKNKGRPRNKVAESPMMPFGPLPGPGNSPALGPIAGVEYNDQTILQKLIDQIQQDPNVGFAQPASVSTADYGATVAQALDERVLAELKILLPADSDFSGQIMSLEDREDDEICVEIRALQAVLKDQVERNNRTKRAVRDQVQQKLPEDQELVRRMQYCDKMESEFKKYFTEKGKRKANTFL